MWINQDKFAHLMCIDKYEDYEMRAITEGRVCITVRGIKERVA